MGRYTLFELERLTGILAHTIRVWERRYGIMKPQRTETNRRWYDDDDLRRLINISTLYHGGYKISKIAKLSGAELEEKTLLLTRDSSEYDTQINLLIVAMFSFNETAVNEILERSINTSGFENTFTRIVFPFLRRVGILWHTGSVNIGAEHFITSIFRRRLITAIDSLSPVIHSNRKKFILFLPENELHELGLLFFSCLIRMAGHEVLYLGQATPLQALVETSGKWNPDILVTGILSKLSVSEPEDYLSALSEAFRSKKILVSGSLANEPSISKFRNIYPVRSVTDLREYL